MSVYTTPIAAKAWAPDTTRALDALTVVPDALVLAVTNHIGNIEGDEPSVRLPYVKDGFDAAIVPEGTEIPEAAGELAEVVVQTVKVANLARFSREMLAQPNAAETIAASMKRGLIRRANATFLNNTGTPAGLLSNVTDGGALGDSLDSLTDALVGIEAAGGKATHLLAAPDAWGTISKMKAGTGSTTPLLGAGVADTQRQVLGVPVVVTPDLPAGTVLAIDSDAVVSAYGQVQLARSDDAFFTSDSVAVRMTFRSGWAVVSPDRVVKLSTSAV